MKFIRIVKAVYVDRVVQPVGAVIEVPKHIAAGLIASGKAEATNPPEPIVEPAPSAPDVEPVKPKGKTKHAR